MLSWAEAEGAAVVPFGGGTSVVGGVEARLGDRPVVSLDLRRLDRVLEVDAESMAARIQAGATGPGLEEQLREHGLTLRHFPAVLRVLDPGWLDRDPGRRALRDPLHAHRRPGRVGAGDHPAWDLGEPAAAGIGRRALAGPDADRLGGDPRRDRRGLGAGAAATRVQGLLRGRVRRLPRRRAGRPRDLPVGPVPVELPPARRAGGGHDRRRDGREEPARAGLRVRPPSGRRADGPGAGDRPRARRHPRRSPGRRAEIPAYAGNRPGEGLGRGRGLAQRLPARPLPARHLRRLRRPLGDLRDGDHLGPLRGVPRRRRWRRCGRRSPRSAARPPRGRARHGSAAASPTSTPTGRRPTSR